jgi:hypothetical protein
MHSGDRAALAKIPGVPAEKDTDLNGSLTILLSASANNGGTYYLRTTNGEELTLDGDFDRSNLRGAEPVNVRGTQIGSSVLIMGSSGGMVTAGSAGPVTEETGTYQIAVIYTYFSGQSNPYGTASSLAANWDGTPPNGQPNVASYYKQVSFGQLDVVPTIVGPIQLSISSSQGCASSNLPFGLSQEILTAANPYLTDAKFKSFAFENGCPGYLGTVGPADITTPQGTIVAGWTWDNFATYTNDVSTQTHEIGHNLGNRHANSLLCPPGESFSTIDCRNAEYGDPFDTMGSNNFNDQAEFDAFHRYIEGWLNSTTMPTVASIGTSTYTLAPIETSSPTSPVALWIPRGNTGNGFTIEYRQPIGIDSWMSAYNVTAGASIMWAGNNLSSYPLCQGRSASLCSTGYGATLAIDATSGSQVDPGNDYMVDGAFLPGMSFVDPTFGITIKTLSATSAGLKVQVTLTGRGTGDITESPTDTDGMTAPTGVAAVAGTTASGYACLCVTWKPATSAHTITQYAVFRDGIRFATVPSTATSFADTAVTGGEGYPTGTPHQYSVEAIDSAGSVAMSTETGLVGLPYTGKENTSTVQLTSPPAGSTVAGVTPISITASSNSLPGAQPVQVEYLLDGVVWGSQVGSGSGNFSLDTTYLSNGVHTLSAEAISQSDMTSSTNPITITVDNGGVSTTPTVASVSPKSGPASTGTLVTISGTNFSNVRGVSFGGIAAPSYTVNSNTSLTAVTPAESIGSVDVTVTTGSGTSAIGSADEYTFTMTASALPSTNELGYSSKLTIGGLRGAGATGSVTFTTGATTLCTITSLPKATSCATPTTLPVGIYSITAKYSGDSTHAAQSATTALTIIAATSPTLTSLSPSSGPISGGTKVTITGTNFIGTTAVTFGGFPASSFTVNSATSITATAPPAADAGAVDVAVISPFGSSNHRGGGRLQFKAEVYDYTTPT